MKYQAFSLACSALALSVATPALSQVVYQSVADMGTGAVDGSWCAACGDSTTAVADQFSLGSGATITGINLWVYASSGYDIVTSTGYTFSVYDSTRTNLIYSGLVFPVVTLDFRQGKISQELLLGGGISPLTLDAGTYWATFHAQYMGVMGFLGGNGSGLSTNGDYSSELHDNVGYQLLGRAAATVLPTPEPASWLMMIAGFGCIGATMRRQRTTVKFA